MSTEHVTSSFTPSGVFRRVLVGFDGSNESRRALRVARSLAADLGGDVHILSVITPPAHAETSEGRQSAIEEEEARLARSLMSEQTIDERDRTPTIHVIYDDNPAGAIAEFAKKHGFDLVVVGTHGTDQIMHRGVGRSLEILIRSHPCPVLVV
jgi:nucleotide-binding universal stress UspA family protein